MLYLLERIGQDAARSLVKIKSAKDEADYMPLFDGAIASGIPFAVSALDVGGGELGELGYKGTEIGRTLRTLLFAAMDCKVENKKEALLEYLKKSRK